VRLRERRGTDDLLDLLERERLALHEGSGHPVERLA
jgi:hypothetical protein